MIPAVRRVRESPGEQRRRTHRAVYILHASYTDCPRLRRGRLASCCLLGVISSEKRHCHPGTLIPSIIAVNPAIDSWRRNCGEVRRSGAAVRSSLMNRFRSYQYHRPSQQVQDCLVGHPLSFILGQISLLYFHVEGKAPTTII